MAELEARTRLHEMASRFLRDGDLPTLFADAIDTAMAIVDADAGLIVRVPDGDGAPKVVAHRGREPFVFGADASARIGQLLHEAHLAGDERIVVEDLSAAAGFYGRIGPLLRSVEISAFQSTPLRSRGGALVGVLSTQHGSPWRPKAEALALLDLVARQCGDAIDRDQLTRSVTAQNEQTQANKLRETEELFRTTVENMPDNLVLYDRDWRILYINAALARLSEHFSGRPATELLGRRGEEVWPESVWNPLRANAERAIATRERQTYETILAFSLMAKMVRRWTVVPLAGPDGEVRQILVMSHDVTAERRLVDELRQADDRKSAFIGMLSHELRNPLAAIRANLYVVEHSPPGSAEAERATKVIDRKIEHMVAMVDDLLDVTRITQNKIELRPQRLDLNILVRQTVEDDRMYLERGGVAFDVQMADHPLLVDADGARIVQVVTNLLTNAAKFTGPGGRCRVSLHADAEGARAVLAVVDTGVGIDPALLERLFQPFMQGDRSLDRTNGGLGLGLTLVKGLVDLHGGSVAVRSDGLGRGAEFIVRLPLVRERPGDPTASAVDTAERTFRRVLVIEDDLEIGEGLRAALRIENHVVEIARNGPSGIELARSLKPEAVLCDLGLPGMDGYAVARAFREDPALAATYLIAFSGYAQAEDIARSRAAGFDYHLAKPASVERIHRALSRGRGNLAS